MKYKTIRSFKSFKKLSESILGDHFCLAIILNWKNYTELKKVENLFHLCKSILQERLNLRKSSFYILMTTKYKWNENFVGV